MDQMPNMQAYISVEEQSNILPHVLDLIRNQSDEVLTEVGETFKRTAVEQCPVSNINTPGYVHLYETIDYQVDAESTMSQKWLTMYVVKFYAEFINNGTFRMAARPFFTNGVIAAGEQFDEIAERKYREIYMGRVGNPELSLKGGRK